MHKKDMLRLFYISSVKAVLVQIRSNLIERAIRAANCTDT